MSKHQQRINDLRDLINIHQTRANDTPEGSQQRLHAEAAIKEAWREIMEIRATGQAQ